MEDHVAEHLKGLYGLDPSVPHPALQFPRLPPGLPHPVFRVHQNATKENMARNAESIAKKLQGFEKMYQEHAAGLFTAGSRAMPPGHPLYALQNPVEALKAENEKLLKENADLRRKLESKD